MNLLKSCRALAQWSASAAAVVSLSTVAGCAMSPWDALFGDSPAAPAPVLEGPTPVAAGYYRANPGDTMGSIAVAFGREPSQVARWNRLPDDYPVNVGQVLRVAPPPGEASRGANTGATAASAATGRAAAPAVAQRARFVWPASGAVAPREDAGQSKGVRIGAAPGETIVAAEGGRVIYAGSEIKAYGLLVIIKHDNRFVSAYGNNARLLVKEGDVVRQGQPIAQMDPTDARSNLIFELRDSGKAVDPQNYLPKRSG